MNRKRFGLAALLGAALLFSPTAKANVSSYTFTANDSSYIVSGFVTLANTINAVFGRDILFINGSVSGIGGANISGLVSNPNQPNPVIQFGFIYDNVGFSGDPKLDNNGLVFSTTNGSLWNLFSDGPGDYELLKYEDASPLVDVRGTLSTTEVSSAVPEINTWAMMLLGFATLGFVAHRRARKTRLAVA